MAALPIPQFVVDDDAGSSSDEEEVRGWYSVFFACYIGCYLLNYSDFTHGKRNFFNIFC